MGRKYVLVDDFDGKELPDDTAPVSLSLGRTVYSIYLSEENHGKLMTALEPFIKDAEKKSTVTQLSGGTRQAKAHDAARNKAIREWAQANKVTFTNAAGEKAVLGDRGRIPDEIATAYDEAHK